MAVKKKKTRKKIILRKAVVKKKRGRKDTMLMHPKINRSKSSDVPSGYNIDTLVLMPVNIHSSFIYWEVTRKLLNGRRRKLDEGRLNLIIKIFEVTDRKEIYSYRTKNRVGKHYISHAPPRNQLIAEIGILKGNKFSPLLTSNPVTPPSAVSHPVTEERWMEKSGNAQSSIRITDSSPISRSSPETRFLKDFFRNLMTLRKIPLSSWPVNYPY